MVGVVLHLQMLYNFPGLALVADTDNKPPRWLYFHIYIYGRKRWNTVNNRSFQFEKKQNINTPDWLFVFRYSLHSIFSSHFVRFSIYHHFHIDVDKSDNMEKVEKTKLYKYDFYYKLTLNVSVLTTFISSKIWQMMFKPLLFCYVNIHPSLFKHL